MVTHSDQDRCITAKPKRRQSAAETDVLLKSAASFTVDGIKVWIFVDSISGVMKYGIFEDRNSLLHHW